MEPPAPVTSTSMRRQSASALTVSERKRLLETWYYNHRGLPRTGRNRFRLIGELQDKPRPAMGAMSGTLALDSSD